MREENITALEVDPASPKVDFPFYYTHYIVDPYNGSFKWTTSGDLEYSTDDPIGTERRRIANLRQRNANVPIASTSTAEAGPNTTNE